MNPFLHATVAQPLEPAALASHAPAAHTQADTASPVRRRLLGAALGLLAAAATRVQAEGVDANIATVEQLQAVRGIGPRMAQIIVQERRRAGPYLSMEDLSDRVRGIGPRKAKALAQSGLRVGAARGGQSAHPAPAWARRD